MIDTKKTLMGLGAVGLIMASFMAVSSANAFAGDPSVKGPNYSAERHEAMEKAFEGGDYEAWSNLMVGKGRVIQIINKDNFSKFVEARKLARDGNLEGAKEIRKSLGLGLQNGAGRSADRSNGNGLQMKGQNRNRINQ